MSFGKPCQVDNTQHDANVGSAIGPQVQARQCDDSLLVHQDGQMGRCVYHDTLLIRVGL